MNTFSKLVLTGAVTFTALMAPTAHAESFSDAQKKELEAIIKSYIEENPNIVVESFEKFRAQQQAEEAKKAEEKLVEHQKYFKRDDASAVGNKNASVMVVEFFDYNCGYCKRALPDVQKIIENDKDVYFVFQEMPILGESSKLAANWALAAKKQGKYFEYHAKLMQFRGNKDEAALSKMAEELGLDVEQMKKDAADPSIATEIKKSMEVATDVGVRGTPAFIINGKLYKGYLGANGLADEIKKTRENAKKDG